MISLDIEQELKDMLDKFYEKHNNRIFGSCSIQIRDGGYDISSDGKTYYGQDCFTVDDMEEAADEAYQDGWSSGYWEGTRDKIKR